MSDTSSVNQAYFNKSGASYDERFQKTIRQLEQVLREQRDFIGIKKGGRLLDYACGTGLLTQALGEDLSQCVGIDVSETMREVYNAKAKDNGFSPEERSAHIGNLILPSDPSPKAFAQEEFFGFDIAGVGLGFHHFDDPELAARRLAERLQPGGVLFILDFMPHEAASADINTTRAVQHNGFSEERIRQMFESAGAGANFQFKEMGDKITFEHGPHGGHGNHMSRRVFFARGSKI